MPLFGHRKFAEPDRLQLKRNPAWRGTFRLLRGAAAVGIESQKTAPQWTMRFHWLTQRQAPARKTPHTEIDLQDADPFTIAMLALSLLT